MPCRSVDRSALLCALLEVGQHLIVGRRLLVGDWPPHHRQVEFEEEIRIEEDLRRRAADAGLEELSAEARIIH